jgi:uncharacterized repeat protein (TIGR01451 family)
VQTVGQNGTATFKITVSNRGNTTLGDVRVDDPRSTDCNRNLGTLRAGKSKSYICTQKSVMTAFQNVATATGKPPAHAAVLARDQARVKVAPFTPPPSHPQITIVKSPKSQTLTTKISTVVAHGTKTTAVLYATATFTIRVTNDGDVMLHGVKVTDPLSPECSRTIGALMPGASRDYSCQRQSVSASFINVAKVTGSSPAGKKVSAADHAKVIVSVKTSGTSGAEFAG